MKKQDKIDPVLKQWATPTQAKYIDAVNEAGSYRKAAAALGKAHSGLVDAIGLVKRRAASLGYAPENDMTRPVPAPFVVKGISTYYDRDGNAKGQWVKSKLDDQQYFEMIRAALADLSNEFKGLAPIAAKPKVSDADLLAVYPFGDPHFGLYAWAPEAGEDFDLALAKRVTTSAVDRLVTSAPAAKTAIVLPLGDVLHIDDQSNQTPASKHSLDADGRFVKVLQVCIHTYRHIILRCLEKHENVIVRFVPGNHDPHAVWSLAFSIAAYFEREPRVTVDLSPSKFWFHRFGKVLIGATHGDTAKGDSLLGVMAHDRSQDWGQTKHRYWYLGHIHHQTVKELAGVTLETFRTLAARDAWAASHGYRSGRDMHLIVHHKDFGEIERHRCDITMIS